MCESLEHVLWSSTQNHMGAQVIYFCVVIICSLKYRVAQTTYNLTFARIAWTIQIIKSSW